MTMRDASNYVGTIALALAAKAKSGSPFTSSAIDLAGYDGCTLIFTAGALGTEINSYTISCTDGDTNTAASTPIVGYLLGSAVHSYHNVGGSDDTSNTVKVASYVGARRYIKVIVTVTGAGTGSGIVGVTVLKGRAHLEPVA
jgi:hypothetical protein